jgi:hypothetical protein
VPLGAGRRKLVPRLLELGPCRKHAVVAARIDNASIKNPWSDTAGGEVGTLTIFARSRRTRDYQLITGQ